jgi:hypothetical protein
MRFCLLNDREERQQQAENIDSFYLKPPSSSEVV